MFCRDADDHKECVTELPVWCVCHDDGMSQNMWPEHNPDSPNCQSWLIPRLPFPLSYRAQGYLSCSQFYMFWSLLWCWKGELIWLNCYLLWSFYDFYSLKDFISSESCDPYELKIYAAIKTPIRKLLDWLVLKRN